MSSPISDRETSSNDGILGQSAAVAPAPSVSLESLSHNEHLDSLTNASSPLNAHTKAADADEVDYNNQQTNHRTDLNDGNQDGSLSQSSTSQVAHKLFIGQIPRHIDESDLRRLFSVHGDIVELIILRDRTTQAHRGCAFLTYQDPQSSIAAIENLHEKISLHNRPLVVRYAGPLNQPAEAKLFVGMLSRQTTQDKIVQLFQQFGAVKEVYLMKDAQTQQSKGCAFVKFHSVSEAQLAIKSLHDQYHDSGAPRKLVVRFADSKSANHNKQKSLAAAQVQAQQAAAAQAAQLNQQAAMLNNLNVYQQANQVAYAGLQQAAVASFGQHAASWQTAAAYNPYALQGYHQAAVASHRLNGTQNSNSAQNTSPQQSRLSGENSNMFLPPEYALLSQQAGPDHYNQYKYNTQSAPPNTLLASINSSNPNSTPNTIRHSSNRFSSNSNQYSTVNNGNSPLQSSQLNSNLVPNPTSVLLQHNPTVHHVGHVIRGPAGCNLFVYNLPVEYLESDLFVLFSPYGAILSTAIYRDPHTGLSRGFGFVSYETPESAELAIKQMNGVMIGNKKLKVMNKKNNQQVHNNQYLKYPQPHQPHQNVSDTNSSGNSSSNPAIYPVEGVNNNSSSSNSAVDQSSHAETLVENITH